MKDKPNILLIMTDQWRADCFSFRKHTVVKTPNIDQLAKGGVWFENAFTVTPLCSPARGSLMTAQWPHQNGIIDNIGVGASRQMPLSRSCRTWHDACVENGYRTGYFGKWHLGTESAKERGVEYNAVGGDQKGIDPNAMYPATERGELVEGAVDKYIRKPEFSGDKPPYYAKLRGNADNMVEHRTVDHALSFLAANDIRPWCLTVSFFGPHFPHTIPEPYASMYMPDSIELPENLGDRFIMKPWFQNRHWWPSMATEDMKETDWKKCAAAYYGYITLLDDEVGRLIHAVEKASGGRKTIVLFTADHGEMLGAHSRFDKGAYMYEEVMRIPLLVNMDLTGKKEEQNVSRKEYCNILDIGATMFDLAGDTYRAEGRSLVPLLHEGEKESWAEEAFGAYYRYNGHSFEIRMIRTPEWKYSYIPQDIDELYDLKNDPGELYNLADKQEYQEKKLKLKSRLFEWMQQKNDYLIQNIEILPSAGKLMDN